MRSLIAAVALGMLLIALPASAQVEEEPPVSEPCAAEDVEAADFVLTPEGSTETIATPTLPSPYPLGLGGEPDPAGFQAAATDVYTVLLDVNPDYISATASVDITWAHTGDIDMDAYYKGRLAGESHAFNPQAGNNEFIQLGRIGHCTTFEVHIRNYIATQGDITMTLSADSFRAE